MEKAFADGRRLECRHTRIYTCSELMVLRLSNVLNDETVGGFSVLVSGSSDSWEVRETSANKSLEEEQ